MPLRLAPGALVPTLPALPHACSASPEGTLSFSISQFYPEEPHHAELCFLRWFHDRIEYPDAEYYVTWYPSWSPCFDCAEEVAAFLDEHRNVSLSIYAARLYQCEPGNEQGLRDLQEAGAQVAMMAPEGESRGPGAGL